MASFIISSAAVAAMSRATSSQTSSVRASNGLKLSNSALTRAHASMVEPFTGLKSNSAFPMSRKVNSITSLTSNGGRALCLEIVFPLRALTFAKPGQWLGNTHNAPEFVGTGNLTNWGEIDVSELQIGLTYSVLYYVTMNKNQTVDPVRSQVKLALDLPNGITKQTSMPLTVEPVNITEVLVGTFTNGYRVGTITFTFSSDDADKWKGLIIKSVVIRH